MKMALPKFDVFNRFTGSVQFTAEIDCAADAMPSVKLGLAVKWAVKAGANLVRADLTGADLAGADLVRANLVRADLTGADLAGADLVRANLAGANLTDANLAGADLVRANLAGANLTDAYLAGAYLAGANLAGANLTDAYLAGAYLAGANLAGANLTDAKIRDGLTLTRTPLFIGPIGRENGTLIAWPTNKGLRLHRGCFFGTVAEFECQSDKTHGNGTPIWTTYRAALAMIAVWDAQHNAKATTEQEA
jgi:hypothetical protein